MPGKDFPRKLQLPAWLVVGGTIVLLTAIAVIDTYTPRDLSMALFYLLPVAATTWFVGRTTGYVMALISAGVWVFVEYHGGGPLYEHTAFLYLNGVSRLGFFLFSVPVLSSWRTMGERLARMVDERTAELRAEVAERQRAEVSLRQLASQLSAAEDAERVRLAYDLHDGLGQMLSLLKMNLETAQAGNELPPTMSLRLTDLVKLVDELIRQTRTLTFELHPSMLDDLGLVATLHGYARDFGQRVGIDVTVSEQGTIQSFPKPLIHYLFRAVKELMNNAARHGKAKEIVIAVHWESDRLRLVLDDDGCGFDPAKLTAAVGPRGLGLPGITERLTSLGGSIHIESQPGQGTRVILEAPVDLSVKLAPSRELASTAVKNGESLEIAIHDAENA